jgi:hypothetical protein
VRSDGKREFFVQWVGLKFSAYKRRYAKGGLSSPHTSLTGPKIEKRAAFRRLVEKILKMHSIDCSKCYEDAQKRLELQEKYPDAVDFDGEEPLHAVDKIVGHGVCSDGKRDSFMCNGRD